MYTIKQAASRSGVSVPLLRAWERRYGIVEPARTASGYRLYDEASISRLRAMRHLVEDGWAPSTAATHIRDAGDEAVAAILRYGRPEDLPDAATDQESGAALTRAFVDAARALDSLGFEAALDDMFARGSFERVASELVMPALVALGEGWATGRLDVAAEHAASNAVLRRLGMAFLAAGRPVDEHDIVLVGMPPGGRHELGALAFATAARRAGVAIRYLGADLPVQDWIDAAQHSDAAAAVIGVVVDADVRPAERVSAALRSARPAMLVAFGGRASARVRRPNPELEVRLPDDLLPAVDTLRDRLNGARAGPREGPLDGSGPEDAS